MDNSSLTVANSRLQLHKPCQVQVLLRFHNLSTLHSYIDLNPPFHIQSHAEVFSHWQFDQHCCILRSNLNWSIPCSLPEHHSCNPLFPLLTEVDNLPKFCYLQVHNQPRTLCDLQNHIQHRKHAQGFAGNTLDLRSVGILSQAFDH